MVIIPRPAGINLVRSMWLFKHKFHIDGTLSHFKARLVANGSSQQLSIDCDETFSPVVKPATIRTVLSLAVSRGLQYLTFTRPDISYAVQQICLYMHDPREPHLVALKRILHYIQGTLNFGFHLYSSTTISLVGYTDAEWAGCPSTRRSTSGYCVFLGDNLLSWSSKRQQTISRSSAESKYRGVANVVAETARLRNLFRELHSSLSAATLVYCDNVSATNLFANPVQHQRTKHIEIDIHFVRDLVTAGQVRVLHVPSRYLYEYISTKRLPSALFEDFRSSLSVRLPPARIAGDETGTMSLTLWNDEVQGIVDQLCDKYRKMDTEATSSALPAITPLTNKNTAPVSTKKTHAMDDVDKEESLNGKKKAIEVKTGKMHVCLNILIDFHIGVLLE
nr:ribonuclease H-like domain-containing protein [Tanacetum cinerariifolium]